MHLLALIAAAIVGAGAGGMLNRLADVLPGAGQEKAPEETIPEMGAVRLERRSLVLLACAAGLPLLLYFIGANERAAWVAAWGLFFLLVAVIDIEHRLVLNKVVAVGAVAALAASLLRFPPAPSIGAALAGGAVGFVVFLIIAVLGRGAMGAGDVKLAGLIGLVTGYPAALMALLAGVIIGGLAAIVVLLMGRGRKSTIPYAPWLVLGAFIVLWQNAVMVAT